MQGSKSLADGAERHKCHLDVEALAVWQCFLLLFDSDKAGAVG